jgi:anti-sigma B factor antagonist
MLHSSMHGSCLRLRFEGPVTIYQVTELKARLQTLLSNVPEAELDLSGVDEIDGAGLQLLVLFKRDAMQKGCRLCVSAHGDASQEVVSLMGLDSWFTEPAEVA